MSDPVRILHLHSTFMLGGKEARAVRLMNAFGASARHSILSAVPGALAAREAIDPAIDVEFPDNAPSLEGKPGLSRYRAFAAYMRGFDLVLSYNWGAMDGVMAHRLGGKGLPPLIHHEDGFNADEAEKLNWKRNAFRRAAFPTLAKLVVPSDRLAGIAREIWKQPAERFVQIPNGIDVGLYGQAPEPGAIPEFQRREGDVVIGTVAGLREVKDIPRLVRAVSELSDNVRLVVVGEGPERAAIQAEAGRLDIADHVLLAGFLDRPWRFVGHFDIFALSSKSEQFPISVVEAMAAGLPVASPDVGDVRSMVAPENVRFIGGSLAKSLQELVNDAELRRSVGSANRVRATADYNEADMIERYRRLYGEAIGDTSVLRVE